jgi:hypothetical protein
VKGGFDLYTLFTMLQSRPEKVEADEGDVLNFDDVSSHFTARRAPFEKPK